MGNSVEFSELAAVLKRLLKEKGITYRSLAKTLKISESSVKKVFIGGDCSLSRLNRICGALGVNLTDILVNAREVRPGTLKFSDEQEKFLFDNRKAFQVYWKIVYEERSAEETKKELDLSEAGYFKLLRDLDKRNFLELLPDGKIRHPDMSMILWDARGPLMELVKKEWAPLIVRRVGENFSKESFRLGLRYFSLRPESVTDLKRAIEEIQIEFGRRSARETSLNRDQTTRVCLLTTFSPSCFVEDL